jgi:hypothetical protein
VTLVLVPGFGFAWQSVYSYCGSIGVGALTGIQAAMVVVFN